ncbi:MAG: hypothetical protein HOP33_21470 [Verrucomicrobia bacterium]|nr:hypothetical protein [Verrucomicrobiota bacterium]
MKILIPILVVMFAGVILLNLRNRRGGGGHVHDENCRHDHDDHDDHKGDGCCGGHH